MKRNGGLCSAVLAAPDREADLQFLWGSRMARRRSGVLGWAVLLLIGWGAYSLLSQHSPPAPPQDNDVIASPLSGRPPAPQASPGQGADGATEDAICHVDYPQRTNCSKLECGRFAFRTLRNDGGRYLAERWLV